MSGGLAHTFVVRVYYEDTDFSGRVYHASYLRFLERGRTEWLRSIGFGHRELAGSTGIFFAVHSLQIEFCSPASIDDLLQVVTGVAEIRRASVMFDQRIIREGKEITKATVLVAALRADRAVRLPESLVRQLKGHATVGGPALG